MDGPFYFAPKQVLAEMRPVLINETLKYEITFAQALAHEICMYRIFADAFGAFRKPGEQSQLVEHLVDRVE